MKRWKWLLTVAALLSGSALGAQDASPGVSTARASVILQRLDLNSFANSTAPRRQATRHTPSDYGLTKVERFDDGWVQISRPDSGWLMSALFLEGNATSGTICFMDTGGHGATYQATQVLQVELGSGGRWTATQVADRSDCQNDLRYPSGIGNGPDPRSAPTFIPHHTMPH